MPTSMLYHTNQITDVQVKSREFFADKIVFHVFYTPKKELCPCCTHEKYSLKGSKIRNLRMAPLGTKAAFLSLEINRLKCILCGHIWWPKLPFSQDKRRVTISFEKHVIALMNFATIKHVAMLLGVSWHLVKSIHKSHLLREYKGVEFERLRYIGVDEFSIKKGHEYMTTFINLECGEIIHAVEGKSIKSVTSFMMQLKENAKNLQAIAMDMNAAYASATKLFLPHVDIVYDRFHVVALLNTAIDEIRRNQQSKCNAVGIKVFKGFRFLLMSNYDNLCTQRRQNLDCLLEINKPLSVAHAMKEQFQLFWMKRSIPEGAGFLACWIMDAIDTGIQELQKTSKTILRHGKDMLNFFKHRITNGKTEGVNNKIKTMKRQAYGFRDIIYFKLRLYNLHKQRYSFAR